MNREQKIQLIKDIVSGMPSKIIELKEQRPYYIFLCKNKGEDIYYVDGMDCIISEAERLKYLPNAIVAINCSKKYRVVKGRKSVKVTSTKRL